MKEAQLEKVVVDAINDMGGWAIKMNPAGLRGIPDRLILLPGGLIFFVEMKIKTGKLAPWQVGVHQRLEKLGFRVHTLWDREQVDQFLSKAWVAMRVRTDGQRVK